MPETPKSLVHLDADKKEDEVLAQEARSHLTASPSIHFMAELLDKLRAMNLPWWTPEKLRGFAPATERLRWYTQRPDLRQHVTSSLTGLAPKAARKKTAEFQAGLIDSVIDDGDTTPRAFEDAFAPADLVVYGPTNEFWHQFRKQMPLEQKTPVHQTLFTWLLNALLANQSESDGTARLPIITPWDLRTAIDGRIWHTHMPIEIRLAVDDARFAREKSDPKRPFHAADDLAIALPQIITSHIPLKDLSGILDAAARSLGFAAEKMASNGTVVRSVPVDAESRKEVEAVKEVEAGMVAIEVAPKKQEAAVPSAPLAHPSHRPMANPVKEKNDVAVAKAHPTSGVMMSAEAFKVKKGTGGLMLGAALGLADENDELQAFIDMDGSEEDETQERTSPRIEVPLQMRVGGGRS